MLTLMTSILAAAMLAQSPNAIVLSGVVVDAGGKPVSGVDVVLPARRRLDGSLPTLAQTTTNVQGEEAFWLAVALMPKSDLARQRGIVDSRVAEAAILLARYDRQVADVFVTQALSSQSRSRIVYSREVIRAKAGVDPRGAVAMIEALPVGDPDAQLPIYQMNSQARDAPIMYWIEPADNHWENVWADSGVPLDDRRFP